MYVQTTNQIKDNIRRFNARNPKLKPSSFVRHILDKIRIIFVLKITENRGRLLINRQQEISSKLIYVLCTIVLLVVMNATIFNVALPTISERFSLSTPQVSWIVVGYAMITAIGSITYGKLADIYPLKPLFMIGLSLFAIGSFLGFFSQSYSLVIINRIIQAAGGSSLISLSMITVSRYFEQSKRARMMGMLTSSIALGAGIGPLAGGFLTQVFGWNYLFLIMTISLLTFPFIIRYIPTEMNRKGEFDTIGAILMAAFVISLLLSVNLSPYFLCISILTFIIFNSYFKKKKNPFIQIELFENRSYTLFLLTGFITFFVQLAVFLTLPIMLKSTFHLNPLLIGVILFAGSMTGAIFSPFSAKWSRKWNNNSMLLIFNSIMTIVLLFLGFYYSLSPILVMIFFMVLFMCYSSIQVLLANSVAMTLQANKTGIGMGLYTLITFLGMSFRQPLPVAC
ncbi:MFS transporter [Neobacillus sp. PS3-34]|uniref:MFS transporter n=1 Tax=Neobacillus sp. PS3-34 TaxID=3070678 RepID=UPI0027E0503B|nr:MFS transporter [Neobacillus sp. PS3-34]WML48967.1 MFS transporter [Neobacillus sp. PS3-34]